MANSQLLNFLKESWYRLQTKSPKFFFVLQLFGASLTLAGYIPSILQQWFNVTVPGHIITMCEDIAKYATGFFGAAMFSAKAKIVAKTDEGHAIVVTNENKLPFSAKVEQKEIDKKVPPLETIPEVPEANP